MSRRWLAVVSSVILGACGDDTRTQADFAGTFAFTAVQCNGGPAFAPLPAAITPPNSWKQASSDGHAATGIYSDGTCNISLPVTLAYPDTATMTVTGAGLVDCSPDPAECTTLSFAIEGRNICASIVYPGTNTFRHTPIPAAAGETVTLTATDGIAATACSVHGLQDPLTYVMTKL